MVPKCPRHFGTGATSAEVSQIFSLVPKCRHTGHFGTSAEMSWVRSVLGPKCPYTIRFRSCLKPGPARPKHRPGKEDVLRPRPVCGASSNKSTGAGVLLIVHCSNSGIMATVYCINVQLIFVVRAVWMIKNSTVYNLLLYFSFCRRLINITAISANVFHLTVGLTCEWCFYYY